MCCQTLDHTLHVHVSKQKVKRHSWHRRNCCISRNCLFKIDLKSLTGVVRSQFIYYFTYLVFIYFSNFFVSVSKPFQSPISHFKISNTQHASPHFYASHFHTFQKGFQFFYFFLLRHDFVYSPFLCNYESNGNETERVYFVCVGQLHFQQRYLKN